MGEGNCTFLSVKHLYCETAEDRIAFFLHCVCSFFSTPHREATAGAGTKRGIASQGVKAILLTGERLNTWQISRRKRMEQRKGCLCLSVIGVGGISISIVVCHVHHSAWKGMNQPLLQENKYGCVDKFES